ncbi:MAG: hypothetical protein ACLFS7_02045 [Desulfosudaceae bacterium]
MTTIMPEGENIRKAVRWVSEERLAAPDKNPETIANEAVLKFDLSPNEAEYLVRFVTAE